MVVILKILIYSCICVGLHCVQHLPWLPCQFTDENAYLNEDNHTETKYFARVAMLQFGQAGDLPINPDAVTFLVTGSKVELRDYMEGASHDQLQCELRRYSTKGIQMRWPVHGAQEYDRWFTCIIKHAEGLFTLASFLRHTPARPPPMQEDFESKFPIGDRDTLTTSAAMVLQSRSPAIKAALQSDHKLHCQFAVDHKAPNLNVEWILNKHGERTRLFSYASRTGQTQGIGVSLKGLVKGDASYSLRLIKLASEGTYICSVSVPPLFSSLDLTVNVMESPRVSLNVGPTLSLQDEGEQKLVCVAEGYYPLDVDMEWFKEDPDASSQRVGAPLPKRLPNILFSSHKHMQGGTYALSAFFYYKASLKDSGSQFTCRVSHASLRMPIRKTFRLIVTEPTSLLFYLGVGFTMVLLSVTLILLYLARKESKVGSRKESKTKHT